MGHYQNLFVSMLEKIEQSEGEEGMKRIYRQFKEVGQEAMSRELVVQLLGNYYPPAERDEFLARHPDLQGAFHGRFNRN